MTGPVVCRVSQLATTLRPAPPRKTARGSSRKRPTRDPRRDSAAKVSASANPADQRDGLLAQRFVEQQGDRLDHENVRDEEEESLFENEAAK